MRKGADHTWEIFLSYHRCPSCGYIFESRHPYEPRFSEWIQVLDCPRCAEHFEEAWRPNREKKVLKNNENR